MVVSVPLARWNREQTEARQCISDGVYLQSLLDLFYKHIAICRKTVHGEYSAVGSRRRVNGCLISFKGKKKRDEQAEHFGGIASLDAVALALTGITSNDGKVCTGDCENCAAVFGVWVELPLLRVCDSGHVRHEEGKNAEEKKRGAGIRGLQTLI
jgi:hypothetical protein